MSSRSLSLPHGLLAGALCVGALAFPTAAGAVIPPPTTIAGPDPSIISVDGVAMASDGTGGMVFRKVVGGVPHVFASRFVLDHWDPPQQVDVGRPFAATMPTIAAARGGRLLVVWATPTYSVGGKTKYNLLSAAVGEHANGFGPSMEVDPNDIGDGSAAYPSLSMADNGNAYVAYRAVTNTLVQAGINQPLPMRRGDELVDVRVARFNGLTWTSLGNVNRDKSGTVTARKPSASNAPSVAADQNNTGIVTWQEPGVDGVAQIWARRLFGASPGLILPVSGETVGGQPVTVDADAPTVAINDSDAAAVSYRLAGGSGSPLVTPHVLLASLPSSDGSGASFAPATAVDGGAGIGTPSVAIDGNSGYRLSYTLGGQATTAGGSDTGTLLAPAPIGPATADGVPQSIDPDGGGVSAWTSTDASGLPVVAVRQVFPSGAWQQAGLSAPISGPISGVHVGGSPLGDGLVVAMQGPSDAPQVIGTLADAPPGAFGSFKPETAPDWVRRSRAAVDWDQAPKAGIGVTYNVAVDGTTVLTKVRRTRAGLPTRGLGDGHHQVQVVAVDQRGQQTASSPVDLQVDSNAPTLRVTRLSHRRIRVKIADAYSGVVKKDVRVVLGDRTRSVARKTSFVHRYARPGTYVVTARVQDEAGNLINRRTKVAIR